MQEVVGQIDLERAAEIEFCTFPRGYSPSLTKEDCWFDAKTAMKAANLAPRYFRHVKATEGPLILSDWQINFFGTTFGWKRPDGTRRYRVVYCEIGRGNGKSTMCMVVVGDLMFLDDEPGADIFSVAGTREQAKEVFKPFKINALSNSELKKVTSCYVNSVTYHDHKTGFPKAVYKAISADADHQHGGSPHGIIFDELHVQPNRDLWDVLETGKVKRRQPLTVAITTAGYDRESICYEQRQYAERVIEGCGKKNGYHDKEFLPVIYAAEEGDDWKSPETWRKANPNMGISIREEDIAKECRKAQEMPAYENTFKRLHLNIWTEQETRLIPMEQWDACERKLDIFDFEHQSCFAGLDLSAINDFTSLVLLFRDETGYSLFPFFWLSDEGMKRHMKRPGSKFEAWEKQGYIVRTPGNVVDYKRVRRDINAFNEQFGIVQIAVDTRYQGLQVATELREDDGFDVQPYAQGYVGMAAPTKMLLELLAGAKLHHDGNPVLRWMASNVAGQEDPDGNLRPSKKNSGGKIDGIVSLIMALGLAMQNDDGSSIYDQRGLIVL